MNNFKTNVGSAFYETFVPAEANRLTVTFEFIFTSKHGSWLNMAEIELHVVNDSLNRHIATMKKIKSEVYSWQNHRNNTNAKINGQFTIDQLRIKLKRFYPLISN